MKKLEEAFAKADRLGRVIANKFSKIKDLEDIRGIGQGVRLMLRYMTISLLYLKILLQMCNMMAVNLIKLL